MLSLAEVGIVVWCARQRWGAAGLFDKVICAASCDCVFRTIMRMSELVNPILQTMGSAQTGRYEVLRVMCGV